MYCRWNIPDTFKNKPNGIRGLADRSGFKCPEFNTSASGENNKKRRRLAIPVSLLPRLRSVRLPMTLHSGRIEDGCPLGIPRLARSNQNIVYSRTVVSPVRSSIRFGRRIYQVADDTSVAGPASPLMIAVFNTSSRLPFSQPRGIPVRSFARSPGLVTASLAACVP
jgi:hypothetical protein